jgi:rhodanese-related sulfurtransferase
MRAASIGHLRAAEARDFLGAHPEALVLDVREQSEWDGELGHIAGARLIPLGQLPSRMGEIEAWKDRPVVVVCAVGARSRDAGMMLAGAGFQQVMNLEGGMVAWNQGGQ